MYMISIANFRIDNRKAFILAYRKNIIYKIALNLFSECFTSIFYTPHDMVVKVIHTSISINIGFVFHISIISQLYGVVKISSN